MKTLPFLFALCMTEIALSLEALMIIVALPTLISTFGDPVHVVWVLTVQFLVGASVAALCGRLGDMYGRRRVLLTVMALMSLGAFISSVSPGLNWIIVGRGLQGGVGAATIPLCFGLVREGMPKDKVPFCVGVIAVMPIMLIGVAPLIGGLLIDYFSWRAVFYVSLCINLLGFFCVWRFVPTGLKTDTHIRLDWLGGILFVPPVAGFLYGISRVKIVGLGDPVIPALLVVSFLMLIFWVRYELRHKFPLIDVRMLAKPQIALTNICAVFFAAGAAQWMQPLSMFLQQPVWTGVGMGVSATMMGILLLPGILITSLGGPLSGRIATARGGRYAAILGVSLLTLVWCALALFHVRLWGVAVLTYLGMLGVSTMYAALPNLIIEAAPPERTSEATGIYSVVRNISFGIGSLMIALGLASSTISEPAHGPAPFPTDSAYTLTFWMIAGLCMLCLAVVWMIPRPARKNNCVVLQKDAVAGGAR